MNNSTAAGLGNVDLFIVTRLIQLFSNADVVEKCMQCQIWNNQTVQSTELPQYLTFYVTKFLTKARTHFDNHLFGQQKSPRYSSAQSG